MLAISAGNVSIDPDAAGTRQADDIDASGNRASLGDELTVVAVRAEEADDEAERVLRHATPIGGRRKLVNVADRIREPRYRTNRRLAGC